MFGYGVAGPSAGNGDQEDAPGGHGDPEAGGGGAPDQGGVRGGPPETSGGGSEAGGGGATAMRGRGSRAGTAALAIAAGACVALTALAGVRVGEELNRPPTGTELVQAANKEMAARWRDRTAGEIFPATVRYRPEIGGTERATRVGIDPGGRCADALDGAPADAARKGGCVALLRATYLDRMQGLLITVGVLAFPGERPAEAFTAALPKGGAPAPGLRVAPFPSSVAARFGDSARQSAASGRRGPYVVLATIGYTDGRPSGKGARQPDLAALPAQFVTAILDPLTRPVWPDCGSTDPKVRRKWAC